MTVIVDSSLRKAFTTQGVLLLTQAPSFCWDEEESATPVVLIIELLLKAGSVISLSTSIHPVEDYSYSSKEQAPTCA